MAKRPDRIPLIVRAIDEAIADVEDRTYPERDEEVELLRSVRSRLLAEGPEARLQNEGGSAGLVSR